MPDFADTVARATMDNFASASSAAQLVFAGVTSYVAVHELLWWARRRGEPEHLWVGWFAVWSTYFLVMQYAGDVAPSPDAASLIVALQMSAIPLLCLGGVGLASSFTAGHPPRPVIVGLVLLSGGAVALSLASDLFVVHRTLAPSGRPTHGPLFNVVVALALLPVARFAFAGFRRRHRLDRQERRILGLYFVTTLAVGGLSFVFPGTLFILVAGQATIVVLSVLLHALLLHRFVDLDAAVHRTARRQGAIAALGRFALSASDAMQVEHQAARALRDVLGAVSSRVVNGDADSRPADLTEVTIAIPDRHQRADLVVQLTGDDVVDGEEHDFLDEVARLLANVRERERMENEIRHQALHDALTGLANRTLLMDRLSRALVQARADGSSVAVLFLDLDRFKVVNDSLGHPAGDHLLRVVAGRLSAACEPVDTVARFGGDEFAVVRRISHADGSRHAVEATELGERLIWTVNTAVAVEDAVVTPAVSIGIALGDGHGGLEEAHHLVRDADTAMYRAKERGGNRVELFDEALRRRTVARLRLEHDLRRAVRDDALDVVYQPIHDRTGRVVDVEALARWHHPDLGDIPPAEFVPVAEETGQIGDIGRFVLARTCGVVRRLLDLGVEPVGASVNMSTYELGEPDLVARVVHAVELAGLAADEITFEVTESALLRDPDTAVETLRELSGRGFRVSLDDFGTGYSSLTYLTRLPVDIVKIDRSFVQDLTSTQRSAKVVGATVDLAHRLGLVTVAEGVETPEQHAALVELGCDLFQGFLLARPMPEPELQALLGAGGTDRLAVREIRDR